MSPDPAHARETPRPHDGSRAYDGTRRLAPAMSVSPSGRPPTTMINSRVPSAAASSIAARLSASPAC